MTLTPVPRPVATGARVLRAEPIAFDAIPRPAWDRLLAATPAATPFARWTFHRAWWEAYGSTAHQQYLACVEADSPRGRLWLMRGLADGTLEGDLLELLRAKQVPG